MPLPRIIEYMLSIRRPSGGGALITLGQTQLVIPVFPPGQTVTIQQYPYQNDYMSIIFQWGFDPAIVPNAFYAWGSYFGARPWEGIAHSWWTMNNIPAFVFVTESEPAYALIFNRSPIAQYYAGTTSHVSIGTEEDFGTMLEEIQRMASSKEQNELAVQTNNLLQQIVDKGVV